jgi:hypothetical protein
MDEWSLTLGFLLTIGLLLVPAAIACFLTRRKLPVWKPKPRRQAPREGEINVEGVTKMNPLSTLNQIREIMKKSSDPELVKLVLDLQNNVFEIESQNLKLGAELVSLRQQLNLRARMYARGPFNYYFQEGDDVPFCPKCWENYTKAIHLSARQQVFGRTRRDCRVCEETYWETPITAGRSQAHHA